MHIQELDYVVLRNISYVEIENNINPSNAKLNPICHLLALLGGHHILHVSRVRVKMFIIYTLNIIASHLMKVNYCMQNVSMFLN